MNDIPKIKYWNDNEENQLIDEHVNWKIKTLVKNLEDLLNTGVLNPIEYEAKKQKL